MKDILAGFASKKLGVGVTGLAGILSIPPGNKTQLICATVVIAAYLIGQGFADGLSKKYATK